MANKSGRSTTLDLQALEKVASGKNRDVYLIPQDLSGPADQGIPLVLKVPRYAARGDNRNTLKKTLQKLFPSSLMRVISNEVDYLQSLTQSIKGSSEAIPIPTFHGFIDTSEGVGALWEAICDANGNLAPTLEDLARDGLIENVINPLNRFTRFCYDQNVIGPDINDRNLVLAERDGVPTVLLIDGFGDHRMISTRSMFSSRNKSSLDSRFQKVARKTKLRFNVEAQCFSARE